MVRKNKPKSENTTVTIKRTTRDRLKKLQEDEEQYLDEIINIVLDVYDKSKQATIEISG